MKKLIFFVLFLLAGCVTSNYPVHTFSPEELATREHEKNCSQVSEEFGSARSDFYRACVNGEDIHAWYADWLGKADNEDLCLLAYRQPTDDRASGEVKRRGINCYQMAHETMTQLANGISVEALCGLWRQRSPANGRISAKDFNDIIDAEVKNRGADCSAIISAEQNREILRQKMFYDSMPQRTTCNRIGDFLNCTTY